MVLAKTPVGGAGVLASWARSWVCPQIRRAGTLAPPGLARTSLETISAEVCREPATLQRAAHAQPRLGHEDAGSLRPMGEPLAPAHLPALVQETQLRVGRQPFGRTLGRDV